MGHVSTCEETREKYRVDEVSPAKYTGTGTVYWYRLVPVLAKDVEIRTKAKEMPLLLEGKIEIP
jgi:hypothetical protein